MVNEHTPNLQLALISLLSLLVVSCSSTTTLVRFSEADLELVPEIAFRRVLTPGLADVRVEVDAPGLDTPALVKAFADEDHVIVTDEQEREIVLPFSEITAIRHRRSRGEPETAGVGETAASALIYGPMIPGAVAAVPFLRVLGLDEGKNSADRNKAALVYVGMSREDLRLHVGEPKERYACETREREVWVYEESEVLRGGRALFMYVGPDQGNLKHDTVYHNSTNTTFFQDDCSLISEQ